MKINFGKLAGKIIQFGGPIVLAAVAHKLATGKLDIKGAVLDAAEQAIADRAGA